MNVFNLLIAAIVAVVLIGLIFFNFGSYFVQETTLAKHADALLLQAQGDLGTTKGITLSLKTGDGLYARNLDEPTRTVSFACSTADCCPSLTTCTQPLSSTADRMKVNSNVKTTLSARCVPLNGLHTCTLYIGKSPAQVDMTQTSVPTDVIIDGTSQLQISTLVSNTGEIAAASILVTAVLTQDQIVAGKSAPVNVGETEFPIESLAAGKKQVVSMTIPLTQTGSYHLTLRAQSADGGFDEEKYDITVTGTNATLCSRNLAKSDLPSYDGIDHVCKKKVYCTACGFAFECTQIWEKEAPLTGGGFYDSTSGSGEYTLQVWPSNGTC